MGQAGANNWFIDNNVILTNACGYGCDIISKVESKEYEYATNMTIGNNSVYVPGGSIDTAMKEFCNVTFKEWQKKGNDLGTAIYGTPTPDEIIAMAAQTLEV